MLEIENRREHVGQLLFRRRGLGGPDVPRDRQAGSEHRRQQEQYGDKPDSMFD
jgi:hypothetical protein